MMTFMFTISTGDWHGFVPRFRFDGWPIARSPGHVWYRTLTWGPLMLQIDNDI